MKTVPRRKVERAGLRKRVLTIASPEFSTGTFAELCGMSSVGTWPTANDPIAIPFRLSSSLLVDRLGWMNGSGLTDSQDIGVYDASWNRLVSGGGTGKADASDWQWVDVTDTWLGPGSYYLVSVANGVTANAHMFLSNATASAVPLALIGVMDSTTDAYPLPNPLTNMVAAATFTRIPQLAIAARAPF